MRKFVGFICFVISLIWIITISIAVASPLAMVFLAFTNNDNFIPPLMTFITTYGYLIFLLMISLLLSVIAMGKYHGE